MYYFNILEPRFICDKAIKVLQREQIRIEREISSLMAEEGFENYLKIQELKKLNYDYYQLIDSLEKLGEFGVQQMQFISKNKDKSQPCIF